MKRAALLLIPVLLLAACGRPADKEAPPSMTEEPSFMVESAFPVIEPGSFWAADRPKQLEPKAFGKLRLDRSQVLLQNGTQVTWGVKRFILNTVLPVVEPSLPVYSVGAYPASHLSAFRPPAPWQFVPQLSLVSFLPPEPRPKLDGEVSAAAARFLQQYDLLPTDSLEPTTQALEEGMQAVIFFRRLEGRPVYGDKPACLIVDPNGQVQFFSMRRRPVLESSLYPVRSPAEAWTALQEGEWLKLSNQVCSEGGRPFEGELAQFEVTSVEVAYWEAPALKGRELMLPYYLFRSSAGQTLYVPAVRTEWIDHS